MLSQRQRVIEVAKTFISTPYHNCGLLKGIGVDCLTLLVLVYEEAGVVTGVKVPKYSPDFMKHHSAEKYLEGLLRYTRQIEGTPLPGDIALWKFGRCFSHAAIVVEWPRIIHAYMGRRVMFEDARAGWLSQMGPKPRPVKFFSCWDDNGLFKRRGQEQQPDHSV